MWIQSFPLDDAVEVLKQAFRSASSVEATLVGISGADVMV